MAVTCRIVARRLSFTVRQVGGQRGAKRQAVRRSLVLVRWEPHPPEHFRSGAAPTSRAINLTTTRQGLTRRHSVRQCVRRSDTSNAFLAGTEREPGAHRPRFAQALCTRRGTPMRLREPSAAGQWQFVVPGRCRGRRRAAGDRQLQRLGCAAWRPGRRPAAAGSCLPRLGLRGEVGRFDPRKIVSLFAGWSER